MNIPDELKRAIEELLKKNKANKIIEDAQIISNRYRNNDGKGKRLLTEPNEVISYAISRMPATYAAVYTAAQQTIENYDEKLQTLFDIGAGTGSATWAINELNSMESIKCFERESSMINIGKQLMKNTELNIVNWQQFDILKDEIMEKADIVITSYMINELPEDEKENVIEKLWKATNKLLIIIEPGTPEGFKNIIKARNKLLKDGGYIVAPCSHQGECEISKDDWCAFYTRVFRSSIHKQAKNGKLGYEDEKFSYIAFSKISVKNYGNRILRHPQIYKGYVNAKLCTQDGIKEKTYSKKDGEIYKKVRKLDAGEKI
mgnify:CR=1 FL=1